MVAKSLLATGQVVGFPFGRLGDHVGDSRGVRVFIERLQEKITGFIKKSSSSTLRIESCRPGHNTGLWIIDDENHFNKVCAFGMRFSDSRILMDLLSIFLQIRQAQLGVLMLLFRVERLVVSQALSLSAS